MENKFCIQVPSLLLTSCVPPGHNTHINVNRQDTVFHSLFFFLMLGTLNTLLLLLFSKYYRRLTCVHINIITCIIFIIVSPR